MFASLQKLTGEYDALKKSHEEVKKALDASKARNKVLCSEVKTLKGQIVILLEKGKHDNELIDALLVWSDYYCWSQPLHISPLSISDET